MEIWVSEFVLDTVDSFNSATLCATVPDEGFSAKAAVDEFVCAQPVIGRFIGFILRGTNQAIHFCEAEVYCSDGPIPTPSPTEAPTPAPTDNPTPAPTDHPTDELELQVCPGDDNLALGRPMGYNEAVGLHGILYDGYWITSGATDGVYWSGGNYGNCAITPDPSPDVDTPFVYIDLQAVYTITKVAIGAPKTSALGAGGGMEIWVSEFVLDTVDSFNSATLCATVPDEGFSAKAAVDEFVCAQPVIGRFIGFILRGTNQAINFCEAEVYCSATDTSGTSTTDGSCPTPSPTYGPSHYIVRGNPVSGNFDGLVAFHCHEDDNNQALYVSSPYAYDIGVGCCWDTDDDEEPVKADRIRVHPATYQEALSACTSKGWRLCTLQETLCGITKGTGESYDNAYQWVSEACFEPATIAAAPVRLVGIEKTTESADSAHNFTSVALGAAIGMAVVAAVAVFIVMRRRKRETENEEIAMNERVTAPKVEPVESMDGIDTI